MVQKRVKKQMQSKFNIGNDETRIYAKKSKNTVNDVIFLILGQARVDPRFIAIFIPPRAAAWGGGDLGELQRCHVLADSGGLHRGFISGGVV